MLNSVWLKARVQAGLSHVRVYDLKHTFGRRPGVVGVSFKNRQDLLGYKSEKWACFDPLFPSCIN